MKRYVIVGASFRCYTMFVENMVDNKNIDSVLTAVYDPNRIRCEVFKKRIGDDFKIYDDFDVMLDSEKPDGVIVATIDKVHHEYIIRALNKGYDVVTEKPITTTYKKCLAIRKAEKKSGKKVTVTFNCRFMPNFEKMKEFIKDGAIGKVLSVNYDYRLNHWHGGDYFKRWHRMMDNSGGMLVHKSTHHFDVVTWLLEDEPALVSAFGNKMYFGDVKKSFAPRCKDCPKQKECLAYESQTAELDEELYFKAESQDGYVRDKCCFLPDSDIYDNMVVNVKYSKGTLLTYSLNLFSPVEGFRIAITGEKGMLVYDAFKEYTEEYKDKYVFEYRNEQNKKELITADKTSGRHNGADPLLIDMVFGKDIPDPLGKQADSFAGMTSALIGISANDSISSGKIINLTKRLNKLR